MTLKITVLRPLIDTYKIVRHYLNILFPCSLAQSGGRAGDATGIKVSYIVKTTKINNRTGKTLQVNYNLVRKTHFVEYTEYLNVLVTQPVVTWYTHNQLCSQMEDI